MQKIKNLKFRRKITRFSYQNTVYPKAINILVKSFYMFFLLHIIQKYTRMHHYIYKVDKNQFPKRHKKI